MTPHADVDFASIERRADALVESHQKLLRDLVGMRGKHRLSQADVAYRMGVSQPTVAAFERYDSNPTLATIRRYALAVEATLDERVVDDCAARGPAANTMFEAIVDATAPTPRFQPSRHFAPPSRAVWKTRSSDVAEYV